MQLAMFTDVVRSYLETGRSWCLTGITRVRVSPPCAVPDPACAAPAAHACAVPDPACAAPACAAPVTACAASAPACAAGVVYSSRKR
jgi:hypothetical protein